MKEHKATIKTSNITKLLHLIRDAKPPYALLTFALCLAIVQTIASLFIPLFTKDLIDNINLSSIHTGLIIVLIGAFVLQAIASGASQYILGFTGQQIVSRIRSRIWTKVLKLPVSYFDHNPSGDIITRMTQDTGFILQLTKNYIVSFFSNIVAIIGAVCILFYLDWVMTTVILIVVPATFLLLIPLGKIMYRISKEQQHVITDLTSLLTQVISEIRLVKAYGTESYESKQGEARINQLFTYGIKETRIQSIVSPFFGFVIMGVLVIIIGYGGIRVAAGLITTGELVAFILLLFQIVIPFSQFAAFYTELQRVMGATERIHTILAMPTETNDETVLAPDGIQTIDVQHLYFSYVSGEPILQDITFKIPARQTTALVGPSGSGKSTFFSLMERFYVPDSGQINYGQEPIEQFTHASWRKKIGYVSQESPLLAGTIQDNIRYGVEHEISIEQLVAAAKMANAHEFIEQLPHGYETEVGERGILLSGGQRQRIAIARALLRNPDILMLDEATSSLDSTSEYEVQKALDTLMQGRTTIVIAHRLSTVVDSDQIIVLEKGRVTGTGTHKELMKTHRVYRDLAQKQFGMNEFVRLKDSE